MNLLRSNKYSCGIALAIIVLSLIPIPEHAPLGDVPFIDKWVHFVMYGTLSIAMWIDNGGWKSVLPVRLMWLMFLLPTILGGLLELAQEHLTDCRSGDFIDFYADAFGAVLGLLICLILRYYGKRKL